MFHSIRWRITWPFVILILAAMIGLGLLLSSIVRQTYLNTLEDKLITESRMVGDVIKPVLLSGVQNNDLDIAAKHWAGIMDARVTIIAVDGTVLGESDEDRTKMTNHLDRPEVAAALKTGSGTSTRYSQTVGYQMMYTATALSDGGKNNWHRSDCDSGAAGGKQDPPITGSPGYNNDRHHFVGDHLCQLDIDQYFPPDSPFDSGYSAYQFRWILTEDRPFFFR